MDLYLIKYSLYVEQYKLFDIIFLVGLISKITLFFFFIHVHGLYGFDFYY